MKYRDRTYYQRAQILIYRQKAADTTLGKNPDDGLYLTYCSLSGRFVSGSRCLPYLDKFNLLIEQRYCGADMKKPRMGHTMTYFPFGALIEAPLMRRYHNKLLEVSLKTYDKIIIVAKTCTTRDRITGDDILLEVYEIIGLSLDSCLVEHLGSLLERCCRDKA